MSAFSKISMRVIFFLFAIMILIKPLQAQIVFDSEKFEKCYEILGMKTIYTLVGDGDPAKNVAKAKQIVEKRSAAIERVLENIKGDFLLASDFGDLSQYETSYLTLAGKRFFKLQFELEQLKREIPCWQYLEELLKVAKLRRPKSSGIIVTPPPKKKPPIPDDPDPYGIEKVLRSAKVYFDQRAEQVAKLEKRLKSNRQKIKVEIRTRNKTVVLKQVARKRRQPPRDNENRTENKNTENKNTDYQMPYSFFIGMGAGATFPSDTVLSPFNQYTPGKTGYVGSLESGIRFHDVIGPADISISLLTEFGRNRFNKIVNFGGGSGKIRGKLDQFSIQPTLRITAPIVKDWEVSGEVGVGVRYQKFKINGAIDTSRWPLTWHVGGNVMRTLPDFPAVRIGPWIKFTRTNGFKGIPIAGGVFKTNRRMETSVGLHIIITPTLFEDN